MNPRSPHTLRNMGNVSVLLRRGVTLLELLAVMGIILVMSTFTLIAVRTVGSSSRLSSGVNTVTAALTVGRSLAIENNKTTIVAFVPRREGASEQVVDVVTAQWSGNAEFQSGLQASGLAAGGLSLLLDRFVVVPDAQIRTLPRGIKVAGPDFLTGTDEDPTDLKWFTQTHLPGEQRDEVLGHLIGIMFGPDGSIITTNNASESDMTYIDFDRSGDGAPTGLGFNSDASLINDFLEFDYDDQNGDNQPDDEAGIILIPYLVVFDDRVLRDEEGTLDWLRSLPDGEVNKRDALSANLNERGEFIHFNRHTGLVMEERR